MTLLYLVYMVKHKTLLLAPVKICILLTFVDGCLAHFSGPCNTQPHHKIDIGSLDGDSDNRVFRCACLLYPVLTGGGPALGSNALKLTTTWHSGDSFLLGLNGYCTTPLMTRATSAAAQNIQLRVCCRTTTDRSHVLQKFSSSCLEHGWVVACKCTLREVKIISLSERIRIASAASKARGNTPQAGLSHVCLAAFYLCIFASECCDTFSSWSLTRSEGYDHWDFSLQSCYFFWVAPLCLACQNSVRTAWAAAIHNPVNFQIVSLYHYLYLHL